MKEVFFPIFVFPLQPNQVKLPEGKFLVVKFEFVGSLCMSLEGDCHE
jgi:hypothetical protein